MVVADIDGNEYKVYGFYVVVRRIYGKKKYFLYGVQFPRDVILKVYRDEDQALDDCDKFKKLLELETMPFGEEARVVPEEVIHG